MLRIPRQALEAENADDPFFQRTAICCAIASVGALRHSSIR